MTVVLLLLPCLLLQYAINTHCHADHVTGTGQIKVRQARQLSQATHSAAASQAPPSL